MVVLKIVCVYNAHIAHIHALRRHIRSHKTHGHKSEKVLRCAPWPSHHLPAPEDMVTKSCVSFQAQPVQHGDLPRVAGGCLKRASVTEEPKSSFYLI